MSSSAPVDIRAVLDAAHTELYVAAESGAQHELAEALLAVGAAVAELIAADESYDAALEALEAHYRHVADLGYLAAHLADGRALGVTVIAAETRRRKAIEHVQGGAR